MVLLNQSTNSGISRFSVDFTDQNISYEIFALILINLQKWTKFVVSTKINLFFLCGSLFQVFESSDILPYFFSFTRHKSFVLWSNLISIDALQPVCPLQNEAEEFVEQCLPFVEPSAYPWMQQQSTERSLKKHGVYINGDIQKRIQKEIQNHSKENEYLWKRQILTKIYKNIQEPCRYVFTGSGTYQKNNLKIFVAKSFHALVLFLYTQNHQKTFGFLMFSGYRTSGMKWGTELEKQDCIVGPF